MIKVPMEDVVSKIVQEKGMTREAVLELIETKHKQLSGLVSKDGAAHIVANELGVKIMDASGRGFIKIKQIAPGARNVDVAGRVAAVYEQRTFARSDGTQGQLGSFQLADDTGTIRVVGWGTHADTIKYLEAGVPVKIEFSYTKENFRGQPELHLNDKSKLTINPTDVQVPEVQLQEKPVTTRKDIKDLKDGEQAEILGTMIQLFDPTFYEVCPQCNKRSRANDQGQYTCEKHGVITPTFSCVLNLYLDDGTGNVRCVLFKNQFEKLIGLTGKDAILTFKENPDKLEELKTALLGNTVKFVGKAGHNQIMDRFEFMVNQVFPEPDLQQEIDRLKRLMGKA